MKRLRKIASVILLATFIFFVYQFTLRSFFENKLLKEVIARLEADSRLAEVLVTAEKKDEYTGKLLTTIKFLEYDTKGKPLKPLYFSFSGNIIQFQSLVVRFDDFYIRKGDKLKGRSAYLFWKVFMLDGADTQEYPITKVGEIPAGYNVESVDDSFERKLWQRFWEYALNPQVAKTMGIKNAQLEAPGTKFIPGMLYTIKIEHDGGMRIDVTPIPSVLRGETIP